MSKIEKADPAPTIIRTLGGRPRVIKDYQGDLPEGPTRTKKGK